MSSQAYREANRERLAAAERARRAADIPLYRARQQARYRTNRGVVLARNQAWRDANREKHRARQRAAYWSDRERIRAIQQAYYEANRDLWRTYQSRRRARMLAAQAIPFTTEQWAAKVAYHGGRCVYCGAAWTDRDHVKPVFAGGADALCNSVPACKSCNRAKGTWWSGPAAALSVRHVAGLRVGAMASVGGV